LSPSENGIGSSETKHNGRTVARSKLVALAALVPQKEKRLSVITIFTYFISTAHNFNTYEQETF
jgi:hypothetical protein